MPKSLGVQDGEILYNYAIRNAMLPQVTGLTLSLGQIFGSFDHRDGVFLPGAWNFALQQHQQRGL